MTSETPWSEERLARLCLGSCPGIGSRTLRKLWAAFDNPQQAYLASPRALAQAGVQENFIRYLCEWRRQCHPQALVETLEKERIRVLFPEDESYPQALTHSHDPPEILFLRGTLKDGPAVSVVGTRRATSYGRMCVERLVPELAAGGLQVVSGLALGIDGLAHQSTLDAKGYTVAVLATGVDPPCVYPRANASLAERILQAGGAVISELPPGTEGRKEFFPRRNRLIAALSRATLVIEADAKSGSLITAKLALEENREVLAVPGSILSATSQGTNLLLKLGAKVCTEAKDVFDALQIDQPELLLEHESQLPLDPQDQLLLEHLTEPAHIDLLAQTTRLNASSLSARLAVLEMKQLVASVGGGTWVRVRATAAKRSAPVKRSML